VGNAVSVLIGQNDLLLVNEENEMAGGIFLGKIASLASRENLGNPGNLGANVPIVGTGLTAQKVSIGVANLVPSSRTEEASDRAVLSPIAVGEKDRIGMEAEGLRSGVARIEDLRTVALAAARTVAIVKGARSLAEALADLVEEILVLPAEENRVHGHAEMTIMLATG
jgi:hypothetical protein